MNDRQPINIPHVPDDATLPQIDDALAEVNKQLLAGKDDQINTLKEIIEIQKRMIARLESQVDTLLFGGGCGGNCSHPSSGRMD